MEDSKVSRLGSRGEDGDLHQSRDYRKGNGFVKVPMGCLYEDTQRPAEYLGLEAMERGLNGRCGAGVHRVLSPGVGRLPWRRGQMRIEGARTRTLGQRKTIRQ